MFDLFIIACLTIASIGFLVNETYMAKITDIKDARKKSITLMTCVLLVVIFIGFQEGQVVQTVRERYFFTEETIQHETNVLIENKRKPVDVELCPNYQQKLRAKKGVASQYGQDVILYDIFNEYKSGIFVDLAAYAPKKLSNTYWLETCNEWSGFCIEGDPRKIVDLVKNRTCQVIPECVTETPRTVNFGDSEISGINGINQYEKEGSFELDCRPLNVLLKHYGSPKRIDYMSLDVEGAEPEALNSVGEYIIDTMTIELAHLRKNKEKSLVVKKFLKDNSYMPVTGFPIIVESPNRNFGNFCDSQRPGVKLWGTAIDTIFDFKGSNEYHTHDVFFVREDSIHFEKIKEMFDC